MNKPFSLSASERIKSKKTLDTLFRTGKAFFVYPYRIVFSIQPMANGAQQAESPLRMAISVPKRHFKHAHDRNKLKRLTREVYRVEKPEWITWLRNTNLGMDIVFLYNSAATHSYKDLKASMQQVAKRIKGIIEKEGQPSSDGEHQDSMKR